MKRPVATGALLGILLTLPLAAVLWLGQRLLGLPFVPFDLFDWLARALPGSVITFSIDTLVGIITGLGLGPTSAVAKIAEQTLAVVLFVGFGTLIGVVFALIQSRRLQSARVLGPAMGLAFASVFILVQLSAGPGALGVWVGAIWIAFAFMVWGWMLGWAFDRLAIAPSDAAVPIEVERLDRRTFMIRLGGASAVITAVGAGVGALVGARQRPPSRPEDRWSARNALPNADATVEAVRGTRSEFTRLEDHYRIDINTRPPVVAEDEWMLRIGGLVDTPLERSLEQLRSDYDPLHQFVTLACISNPMAGDLISTTRWTGIPLRVLLDEAGTQPAATHVKITSADGFFEIVAIDTIRADDRVMLTYAWDGVPLPTEHGFPLRIYIPDRYGMKQPKWIEAIEVLDHWEAGYWVERGWDRDALMKATSVIDTVGANMMLVEAGAGTVPIGGIAHAGARGIASVEVRVDEGPWSQAQLRRPLSDTTWVIWRYDWPFEEGSHTLTVRCTDGNGRMQIAERTPVRPDGATGLHSVEHTL